MRRFYSLLLLFTTPLLLAYFGLRGLRDRRYLARWNERFGWRAAPQGPFDTLVHAASLGEVNAAQPLISELLARDEKHRILVTTMTPTGSQRVSELFGSRVDHAYLPIDFSGAMRRLIARSRPALITIIETEIWPNFYFHARRAGVPLVIANARLTQQSVTGYQRLAALVRPALAGAARILAQSDDDARRFQHCGATPDRVERIGNLKFDIRLPASLHETGELLRTGWGVQRPVLVAGSTHEADEAVLLEGFRTTLEQYPEALLVLAPRYPERFDRAAQFAAEAGLTVQRRSASRLPGAAQCLVLDTMGELLAYYAAADVAFVGGTIAPVGGHNLLEPAALGKPLLFGPHTAHVRETGERLLDCGAAVSVANAGEVVTRLQLLFADPARRDQMGRAGLRLVESGRGALEKTLAVLDELRTRKTGPQADARATRGSG